MSGEETVPRRADIQVVRRWALRLGAGLLLAITVGAISSGVSRVELERIEPAGFGAGLLHGVVMPCALPALVMGRDVMIYAVNNSGRPYKLGYTLGVNLCGAVFFGAMYRRRARATAAGGTDGPQM